MADSELNAVLISIAYKANSPKPWSTAKAQYTQRLECKRGNALSKWSMQFANQKAVVFRHNENGAIRIAIRGTDDALDALIDAESLLSKSPKLIHAWNLVCRICTGRL
jgi:hypothetical protein